MTVGHDRSALLLPKQTTGTAAGSETEVVGDHRGQREVVADKGNSLGQDPSSQGPPSDLPD